jgi:4-hydroxymandelate oxidase
MFGSIRLHKEKSLMDFVNLDDYEAAARDILPKMTFDYIAGGSDDEITLRENRAAFERWRLRPRVLTGVGERDLSTTILGQKVSFPVGIAPSALHMLAHPDGELATARAAGSAGVVFCVSTFGSYSMEDVAEAASGPRWFQLYCYKDRGLTENLVERAVASRYEAIVLTADAPVVSRRLRDVRNRFAPPPGVSLKNFQSATDRTMQRSKEGSSLSTYVSAQVESNLTWKDVDWLVNKAGLPVLVKGILTAEDARLAAEHGAAGVIVSNHGGRQLDGAITAIDALPEIVEAADGKLDVLADGGVRRGTDVLKLLALGAKAALIGRPVQWGLAVDGEAGAKAVLDLLRMEIDIAMALSGCRSIVDIKRELVVRI